MVIFSQWWNGNDFFEGTIAIDGFSMVLILLNHHHWMFFFTDWPLTSMVFQWFSPNSGTMVNNGFGLFKKDLRSPQIPSWDKCTWLYRKDMNEILRVPWPFCWLKTKSTLLGPHLATIDKLQWFSKAPSPLNGMVMVKPLVSMVFQWFWCQATIGFNGFRWLSAIDPTMEWLHTIVEV